MRGPEALTAAAFFLLAAAAFLWIPGVAILLALIAIVFGFIAFAVPLTPHATRVVLFSGGAVALIGVIIIPTIHPIIGLAIMIAGLAMCAASALFDAIASR